MSLPFSARPFLRVVLVTSIALISLTAFGNDVEDSSADQRGDIICEIVGLCESPTPTYGWWDAEGKPLDAPPDLKAAKPSLGKGFEVQPDQMLRLLVLRVQAPQDAAVQTRIDGAKVNLRLPESAEGPIVEYSIGHLLLLPEAQAAISFRIGVASGEWKTVAVRPRREDEGNVVQFDLAELTKDGVRAFTPGTEEMNLRVMAEDDEGQLHPSKATLTLTAEGTVLRFQTRFELPAARIRNFHLHARPYLWREFRDVALQPDRLPIAERIRLLGGVWAPANSEDAVAVAEGNPSHAKLRWYNIHDGDLALLSGVAGLRELDVASPYLTNRGVEHLVALAGLERLRIVGSKVSGEALDEVAKLKSLRSLEVTGEGVVTISAEQLEPLTELRQLTHLKLWDAPLTDDGLAILGRLPQVQAIYADGRQVTDAGLAHLRSHGRLEILDLGATNCTDAGLAHLADCRQLKSLGIIDPQITDSGLEHLKNLVGLERLDLRGAQVTDAGLKHLHGLKNLEWMDLRGTQVTPEGAQRLTDAVGSFRYYLPEPKKSPTVTARGRVVNGDGSPIAGARVFQFTAENAYAPGGIAWGPGRPLVRLAEGRTDDHGRFKLPFQRDQAQQHLVFWAIAPDGRSGSRISFRGDLDSLPEQVVHVRQGRITFRVLDHRGRPAKGVQVVPLRLAEERNNVHYDTPPSLLPLLAQTTDGEGRAEVLGYAPDRLVNVGFISEESGVQATGYAICKHTAKDGEIVVLLEPTGRIEGKIVSAQKVDYEALEFVVYSDSHSDREFPGADATDLFGSATVKPDGEGRFVVPAMSPGWLRFIDRSSPAAPAKLQFPPSVRAAEGEPLSLTIEAVETAVLRGSVLLSGSDEGVPDFEVTISHGRVGQDWANTITLSTDKSGRFAARVIPGEVRIDPRSIHPGYHDTTHWEWRGGRFGGPYHVPAGVRKYEAPAIVLVPAEEGAGRLVDAAGKPLSGWSVYGYPSEESRKVTNCVSGHSDRDGAFTYSYPHTHPPQSWAVYGEGEYHSVQVQSTDPLVLKVGPVQKAEIQ